MSQTDITLPANIGRSEIHDLPDRPPFMLIREIADLFGLPTRNVQSQFRRNKHHFPDGSWFVLTPEEYREKSAKIVKTSQGSRADQTQYGLTEIGALFLLRFLKGEAANSAAAALITDLVTRRDAREAALRREIAIDRQEYIGKKVIRQRIAAAAEVGDSYLQLYGRWQHSHRALTAEIEAMRLRGYIAPDALVPPLYILRDLQRKADSIAAEVEDTRQMRLGLEG